MEPRKDDFFRVPNNVDELRILEVRGGNGEYYIYDNQCEFGISKEVQLQTVCTDKSPRPNLEVRKRAYMYKECPNRSQQVKDMCTHFLLHEGEKPLSPTRYAKHSKQPHLMQKEKTYTCYICFKKCTLKHDLKTHIRTEHERKRNPPTRKCSQSQSPPAKVEKTVNHRYPTRLKIQRQKNAQLS